MTKAFLLSLGAKILDFFRTYFIFLAIGYPIGVQTIVFVWAIVLIFSMLPGLPGNLGIVEAGAIAAYVFFGVPAPIAAAAVLVDRVVSFWMLLGIGGSIFGINARLVYVQKVRLSNLRDTVFKKTLVTKEG